MSRIKYYDSTTQTWKYSDLAVQNPLPVGTNNGDILVWDDTEQEWVAKQPSRLPNGYQEVEYIESTNAGQKIDTGIKPNGNTSASIDFTLKSITTQWGIVFGAYVANNLFALTVGESTNKIYVAYASTTSPAKTLTFNSRSKLQMTPSYSRWAEDYYSYSLSAFSSSLNIGICGPLNNPYSTPMCIYGCQISEAGFLLRDLVPCYRKSDNEIGMYDLVSKTFFTNAGTGTFLKGNDVN